MTNSCTCKAEHWQPHKVDCPAYKPPAAPSSVSTLRLLAKCGSMDLSALGVIADEIERLTEENRELQTRVVEVERCARELLHGSDEPGVVQRVCHALTDNCVMVTDPERQPCTPENCAAMKAALKSGGSHEV